MAQPTHDESGLDQRSTGTSAELGAGVPKAAPWIVVVCLLIFFAQAFALRQYSIDDAAISFRYARHLAEGEGLVWNPGQPPVEGFSNLSWVLLLGAGHALGFDIEILAKLLGVFLGAATLLLVYVICRRIWGLRSYWWFPVAVAAVCPVWVMWMVSGLELALYGFLATLAVFALTCGSRRRIALLTVATCALCLTRPEGITQSVLLVGYALVASRRLPPGRRWKTYAIPAMALALCLAGLVVFRLTYYGSPLPNTVYAKFSLTLPSLGEVSKWLLFVLPFLAAATIVPFDGCASGHRFALGAAAAMVMMQMLVVLPVSTVMNFLHRYQIPLLPLAALLSPALLDWLARKRRRFSRIAGAILLVWAAQQWSGVIASYQAERHYYRRQECVVEKLRRLPGQPMIALLDAGRIPYWSDLPALDAWGLCDARIAREGFSPEAVFRSAYGPPDVYIMSVDSFEDFGMPRLGYDQLISGTAFFQEKYKFWQVCPGEWYYGYAILLNVDWATANGLLDALSGE